MQMKFFVFVVLQSLVLNLVWYNNFWKLLMHMDMVFLTFTCHVTKRFYYVILYSVRKIKAPQEIKEDGVLYKQVLCTTMQGMVILITVSLQTCKSNLLAIKIT